MQHLLNIPRYIVYAFSVLIDGMAFNIICLWHFEATMRQREDEKGPALIVPLFMTKVGVKLLFPT